MQWGPNATTWLLPSELFPTEVRAVAHGISAAAGKLGALIAGLAFHSMSNTAIFYVSAACGLIGGLFTWLFVPDVTTLDMAELDKQWLALRVGGPAYTGPAIDAKHLSVWERLFVKQAAKSSAPMPELDDKEAVNSDAAVEMVAVKSAAAV